MSIATVYSRAQTGMYAQLVSVEVHIANGLPNFSIVGLPETAVRESKDRVRAAIINSNFEFPTRRITVNLAPADLPKQGGRFDLPIALGLLAASNQIKKESLTGYEFLGELGLSGDLRKSFGVLPAAHACQQSNSQLITSYENIQELAPISDTSYLCADHLLEVCAHLNKLKNISSKSAPTTSKATEYSLRMEDVHGQQRAKRALSIAAAGHHHVLMIGSPGSGKSMLANRFPSLLTKLSGQETLETSSIYSIANVETPHRDFQSRPFRAPHHTVSAIGLAGGGSTPKPGEISLAHNGVLFLDELTEFDKRALEILREPLETGIVSISRAASKAEFPARFQLIAAMNPCPNGCDIDQYGQCECSSEQIKRYQNKISAPLLDRFDIQISVPKLPNETLIYPQKKIKEDWQQTRHSIITAKNLQLQRQGKMNGLLEGEQLHQICVLSNELKTYALELLDKFSLSARAYYRIIKTARTIADMDQSSDIAQAHLAEAMSYRQFDRLYSSVK